MAKISIIIPVYNAEKYIEKTIESVFHQTFTEWELILINDGSTDDTKVLLDNIRNSREVAGDKRVKVVHTENQGPASARNTGIDIAEGDYLSFVDSDDYIEVNYLERLYNVAEEYHADVVWCNFNEVIGSQVYKRGHHLDVNKIIGESKLLEPFYNAQLGIGSLCNKFYNRSFIEKYKIRINPERYHGEDWEFNLAVFKNNPKVVPINDFLYNYVRQNSSSVVASYHPSDFYDLVRTITMLAELAREKNILYDSVGMLSRTVYNIIGILVKLSDSNTIDKVSEFKEIVNHPFVKKLIADSYSYSLNRLTLKQKGYYWLIKCKLVRPTIFFMKIFQ